MSTTEDITVKPAKASKSGKPKKEKSSKKRKAEALLEPQASETSFPSEYPSSAASSSTLMPEHMTSDGESSGQPPSKKRRASATDEIEVDITAPEPPSKKELRRLKKGKPLPPSKSGAETPSEPGAQKPKKSEVEKRSEHGIWIGNLPFHVSKQDLHTFFVEYSDITEEMITRIHMPGPNDGKPANKVEEMNKFKRVVHNKGFAYVDFSSAKGVELAVELSEQLLSGRRVLIKDNKSFEGRPQKTKEESRNDGKPPSKRVFLGNLSYDTTEDSLKNHFEKCGAIESVKIATFEDSGKCKGYAWVVFEELEGGKNAVQGFVRIEEEASESEDGNSDEGSDSEAVSKTKPKKTKLRKWWVNKIKGRPLRVEFAEDAQVRYKKRYGRDGTKKRAQETGPSGEEVKERRVVSKVVPTKVEYRQAYAPRLTGGILESKGSKITF